MQSMTRSVDAVEGVGVAKTMASGGTVSHSASAAAVCGNQSSVVVTGCRRKRKSLPGLSTCIKKFCNSASSEITKSAEAEVVKSTVRFKIKRKERVDDEIAGDDASLVDAARALTEFSLSLGQSKDQVSPPPTPLQWATTKIRSGRIRRVESLASNEDSHAIIASAETSPPLLQESQQQEPVSECSSSPAGDSQSVVTLVKVEEDPLCSSTEGGEEQGQGQDQEDKDQKEKKNGFLSGDPDRLHNLVSYSSNEFAEPDSRVESPSSPLPFVLGTTGFNSICAVPKFEAGRSAFQRVVPVRPVKKATGTCKLKVEERTFEALNPEQAAVKHVSRKKPRPTGLGQQQQQQLQHQHHHYYEEQQPHQELAPVKIEESDPVCTLALGPCLLSAEEEKEEVKKNEETRSIVLDAAVAVVVEEKRVKLDPVLVKVESKFSGRLGQRIGGKPKPALSESEKEARKQRRVQANRESARQTIRRKQDQIEERTRRSEQLTIENEAFRKQLELMRQKHKDLTERNMHLKEQVVKAAANHEVGPASPTPSSMEKPSDGLIEHHFSLHQFGGIPFPPPYLWFTVAPAAQAAGMQPGETNMGTVGYASALTGPTTAFGSNVPVGLWNVVSGSQGQASLSPPFFPHQTSVSSVASTFPSTSATTSATIAPLTRSMSLPVAPADGSFSLVAAERTLGTGKSLASYRSGDFADAAHLPCDVKRNAVKGDIAHQGSEFSGRAHYLSLTPGSQLGLSATAARSLPIQKSADGNGLAMSNVSSQLLGRAHSLAAPPAPKMVHSRYPMFGCGGISMAQERPTVKDSEVRAAAAAKARRRRIELTRTKSMQHRQTARLAEPSA